MVASESLQYLVLGILQGIFEWLPVSSDGVLVLVKANFFPDSSSLAQLMKLILFLHLGTFLAALVYLRKDVWGVCKTLVKYPKASAGEKKLFNFLLLSTIITGLMGFGILTYLETSELNVLTAGRAITLFVGFLLLGTASIQLRARGSGNKTAADLGSSDSTFLGLGQGLATLPGISRSGITTAFLMLRNYDKRETLRISFLMSLPVVLAGNIFLNFSILTQPFSPIFLYGLLSSFVFGLLTIHALMKLAERINFGWFVLIFGVLTVLSGLFFI